jgi:alkylation response protein AidB-like acyl-CoA dehydrogenase
MSYQQRKAPPAGGAFLIEEAAPETILTPEMLDAEARMLAQAATDFLRGEVLPAADRLEAHEEGLMPALLRRAGALGLLGLEIPEEYGGLGLPKSVCARIAEALGAEPSFAVSHNVHTSVAALPILFFGTPEQKRKYLPKLATGEWIGAYALSESQAGTDAMASRTRAIPSTDGSTYSLTGEKMWITNGAFADLFTVFAKVEGQSGLTAFLVERSWEGVSIGREEHKLGLKGSSTCRLILDNVTVPAANMLGAVGEGGKVALYTLNLGRFKIAASSVGQSKNLLGIATRYAKQRIAFGKPIAEFGLIQEKLATMAARVFAAETMLYRVAGYLDAAFDDIEPNAADANSRYQAAAEEYAVECALLKVACTETLNYCADECLQIHGGYGFTEEFPAARAWRDARVNRIYEGTNEINRLNVVQLLLKRIEKERIDMEKLPSLSEAEPGTPEAFRAISANIFAFAQEQFDDLLNQQEIMGELADMLIALFSVEYPNMRANRMVEAGSSQARWESAFAAKNIILANAIDRTGEGIHRILSECDESEREIHVPIMRLLSKRPNGVITQMRTLARAVIEADGYIW